MTWLGHATVLIEVDGVRLLTDPVLRRRVGPLVRISGPDPADTLTAVDCVLLSHLHADHADIPSLRRIAGVPTILAPAGSAAWLRERGLQDVRELEPGGLAEIGAVRVTATRAVHNPHRGPLGPRATPVGYLVQGAVTAYFAGDTDLFEEMADLRGLVDVALLPVWGWGRRLGPGHLNPERAARAAAMIGPRVAIPIHWGTLALGWPARPPRDTWRPAREFQAFMRTYAPTVEVRVLAPGARLELSGRSEP